tara:strand:- start:825 stop:1268 length:444 start_codon:yes stop_codon:yes gene_type:complete
MTTLTQLLKISGSPWVATDSDRLENDCMDDIIERFDDCPEALIDFERSDWVNMAECYTYQSLERWNKQEDSVRALWNGYVDAIGACSSAEALSHVSDGFEDGDDMNAAIVNLAMTWGCLELLQELARYAYEHTELGGQLWENFRRHA